METKRLGRLQIQDEFKFSRLLYRLIVSLFAMKDPSNVDPSAAIGIGPAGSIGHQAPRDCRFPEREAGWNLVLEGQVCYFLRMQI